MVFFQHILTRDLHVPAVSVPVSAGIICLIVTFSFGRDSGTLAGLAEVVHFADDGSVRQPVGGSPGTTLPR
jgi:hypothetical protein